jgi:uncharacterized protein YndB with AHSA1/START domain
VSFDVRITVPIRAAAPRVFQAVERREDLDVWFCEACDVSPAERRYDFWGRHTPGAPAREAGRHPLVAYEPGRSLAFDWTLRGGPSRVSLAVEPAVGGATLALHHELARGRSAREGALADFWAGGLERLKAWIERGGRGYRPDYGEPPTADLTMSVDLAAAPAALFRVLVDPTEVGRYLAMPGRASIEPRVGGRYDIGWGEDGPRKILEIVPDEKIAYSWRYRSEPETVVTWTLDPSGAATRLTLTHTGFADASSHAPYFMGWGFFLNRIKLLVEAGQERAAEVTADDYEETAV